MNELLFEKIGEKTIDLERSVIRLKKWMETLDEYHHRLSTPCIILGNYLQLSHVIHNC